MVLFCFTGEAGENIRGNAYVRHFGFYVSYQLNVFRGSVLSVHGFEHFVRTALQGKVKVFAEFIKCGKTIYEIWREVFGVAGHEADTFKAGDIVYLFKEFWEAFA